MIYLNPNRWFVRWYLWSVELLEYFVDNPYAPSVRECRLEHGTNRCDFIKTVLIKAPLVLAYTYGSLALGLWSVTYLPYSLFGWKGPAYIWGGSGVIAGLIWLYDHIPNGRLPSVVDTFATKAVVPVVATANFTSLVWGHLKDRFCPRVVFKLPSASADEETSLQ